MKTLKWCRKNPKKRGYSFGGVEDIVQQFEEATQGKMLCSEISGKKFLSAAEHTEYIQRGGCKEIIEVLANTRISVAS
jgi:hypothetical protein